MNQFAQLPLLAALVLFIGCQEPASQTTPVTGLVTLDGQPCAGANVTFIPTGDTRGNGGTGQTDETGKFVAHLHSNTAKPGAAGLFPGQYKVLINKTVNPDGTPFVASPDVAPIDANARELLHPNYSNFETTKLRLEVGAASVEQKFELRADGR